MTNQRVLLIAALCTLLIGAAGPRMTLAQVGDADTTVESGDVTPPDDPEEQKRQAAVAALLMLALVCIVFLFLILVVVMWARRMRRMVRQPLPDQHPGDPLWYLRKPNAEAVPDDES